MPLVSIGTITIDCCEWRGASVSVLPMKTTILQRGSPAPLVHHLRPLMTYSSPFGPVTRSMREEMLVASDEATAGSVMANALRIFPSSKGSSQVAFISAEP